MKFNEVKKAEYLYVALLVSVIQIFIKFMIPCHNNFVLKHICLYCVHIYIAGYENSETANEESFHMIGGKRWFDTGDMGSMDANDYLFITGRSKEVINRGGETISPFEIEEAIVQHPYVKETLAFSAPHATFQESVGAVIVTKKDMPRVDLPSLHKYLENKLHRSKWFVLISFN